MKYCTKCLYPETKPDIWFNEEGVCAACLAYDDRKLISWEQREELFCKTVKEMKNFRGNSKYDCIVPVSGGKDSTYQVLKCLEYGLNVLAVTATTDDLTPLGRQNLDNISNLGVDHIEITPNKRVRKKINKYTLGTIGDISWAEHISIFSIPFRVAQEKNINYIVWGENPQNEYGGPLEAQGMVNLDQRWLSEYGGLNGLRIKDLMQKKIITSEEAEIYRFPAFPHDHIKGIFLGNYFEWDGYKNYTVAVTAGFRPDIQLVEGSGFTYENLDNYQTGIHDYFKYLKFGFGRATDIVNNHIRRNRLTRESGKEHILKWDGRYSFEKYRLSYLGETFDNILNKIDVSIEEFEEISYKFANKKLFDKSLKPLFLEDLENA